MTTSTPLSVITTVVESRHVGDIDTALACYAADVTIVAPDGTESSGLPAARTRGNPGSQRRQRGERARTCSYRHPPPSELGKNETHKWVSYSTSSALRPR
jgi:hypothetical protein